MAVSTPDALTGMRILIVEDTAIVAEEIRRLLSRWKCEIHGPYATVEGALAAVESLSPLDAALLDVNIAGTQVYPVAAALERRKVPFIFMTGYANSYLDPQYRGKPAIEKPFSGTALALELARLLPAHKQPD